MQPDLTPTQSKSPQPKKQLTLEEIMSLNTKRYPVQIPDLGIIQIRRATGRDHAIALAASNDGEDSLRFQNVMVASCVVNPPMNETDVENLPSGIPSLILQKIGKLTNEFTKDNPDFLSK